MHVHTEDMGGRISRQRGGGQQHAADGRQSTHLSSSVSSRASDRKGSHSRHHGNSLPSPHLPAPASASPSVFRLHVPHAAHHGSSPGSSSERGGSGGSQRGSCGHHVSSPAAGRALSPTTVPGSSASQQKGKNPSTSSTTGATTTGPESHRARDGAAGGGGATAVSTGGAATPQAAGVAKRCVHSPGAMGAGAGSPAAEESAHPSHVLQRPIEAWKLAEEAAAAAAPRDKSGGIDRSKFILENAGVLTDFYDLDSSTLGQGTYGSVSKARKKDTGQMRAVKTISKSQVKNLERFRQEIAIMKELDHPNVIKLFETFEDHRNIYLVMELCTGGELFDRIISEGRLTEKHAAVLMKQMFSAVHYLHTNNIMHRDLKPENFLFLDPARDSPLKIIDFGLSCRFKKGEFVSTKAGTPYYVAPQVLQGKYDYRCDAWSLGVILYILLCGYPPFYGETDAEVLTKVKAGVFSFSGPEWKRVSEEAKDLICQLIKINPQERFTTEQALQHPWVTTLARNSQNVALPTTLMSNLKAFRAQNKLKKAALTVIAQHMSEKEIDHLRQIFVTLDVDNSGTLSVHEIREGLKRLGWTEIPADLQAIIEEVDSDNSGHIDYTEFIAATMDKKLYMKEDVCWAAFRVFDLDGNGKISQDELKKVLGMPDVETAVGRATIEALLTEVDLNGDGEIDFDEFMYMMRKKEPSDKRFDLGARKTLHSAALQPQEGRRSVIQRPSLSVVPPLRSSGSPKPAAAGPAAEKGTGATTEKETPAKCVPAVGDKGADKGQVV
ncbi:calcium-dependent protein kinase CDPK2A [Besnoitia besnoiti]|uniref:Calcium-dependent protein kinase 1 n=1 Tax=Besnoitia besnoiti TaxID=94643 RepID=A0A2A9MFP2_BESBE|nr:calcium-dependent protein kinase CDPK2A [Besnoitia besnoiti]PFH36004.1 calcium-dependent protein kinase CDPK2A [Besnoitia besnoiti]